MPSELLKKGEGAGSKAQTQSRVVPPPDPVVKRTPSPTTTTPQVTEFNRGAAKPWRRHRRGPKK